MVCQFHQIEYYDLLKITSFVDGRQQINRGTVHSRSTQSPASSCAL